MYCAPIRLDHILVHNGVSRNLVWLQAAREVALHQDARSERGKMNVQLVANEENQDRAQCRENEAGWMISLVSGAKKQVGDAAAEERSDYAEDHCPHEGQVHVHHGFRDEPCE
jgi:uncharacterized membrane protein